MTRLNRGASPTFTHIKQKLGKELLIKAALRGWEKRCWRAEEFWGKTGEQLHEKEIS